MITLKNILRNKEIIRKEILRKLKAQTKEERFTKSAVIKEKLFRLDEFKKAKCVVFFVSMDEEVYTHQMIDESIQVGKRVGVPIVAKGKKDLIISQITDRLKQLEIGPYDIYQPRADSAMPIPYDQIDLILVPGLAFDKAGNRLGRGKGYYDRFLGNIPRDTRTIGLCYDFQILKAVPTLANDISVQMLLSN